MGKLRLRADIQAKTVPPELVFLLSEYYYYTLEGHAYSKLVPLLDGQYDIDGIINALAGQVSAMEVRYALSRLRKAGYVVEVADTRASQPDWEAYYELQQRPFPALAQKRVAIIAYGLADGAAMIASLAANLAAVGVQVLLDQTAMVTDLSVDLFVVLTADYLEPELAPFNQQMIASGTAWMLVKPVGAALWLGPLFRPSVNACWECMAQRLRYNRRVEAFIELKLILEKPIKLSKGALPSTIQTALAMAATKALHWLDLLAQTHQLNGRAIEYSLDGDTETEQNEQKLVVFDTVNTQLQHHMVVRRPQCPVCGKQAVIEAQPIALESHFKVAEVDGGYRSSSPQATFERYTRHVSEITGAVGTLEARLSTELIHVYAAGNNASRPLERWDSMRRSLRSLNGGKGIDDLQAKVGALCEALERYSGQFEGNEPRQTHTYQDISRQAIHPEHLLLYSHRQYDERDQFNKDCAPNLFVPRRFDESRAIEWSPTWSLSEERQVFVPTAYCYYGYRLPSDHYFCFADSNGNAAGSSREDAILQGFMELVERDAVAIWWYNRVTRPAVAFDHPYMDKLRPYFKSLNRELWLLDITTDLNIPVCVALSRRYDKPTEDIVMGFGAHFDLNIAALRAVTEHNQMLRPVLGIDADGRYASESPWEIDWWQTATIASDPYVYPDSQLTPTQRDSYPRLQNKDLRDDVRHCINLMRQHEMEVLVLDQTRPDIGLPVVKVIVPGLSHFWGRFAPGRLYNVPVKLGWLPDSVPEAQLNPRPMTL